MSAATAGRVVILNGAPRSGKSSIAAALQQRSHRSWFGLGVDSSRAATPPRLQPGIGLRPGGDRPDLEPSVAAMLAALYGSVAAHARAGLDVVVDVGHHTAYATPLNPWAIAGERLTGLPVLLVGVRCPADVVLERRRRTWGEDDSARAAVERWDAAVHTHRYDIEVDTSRLLPEACADLIDQHSPLGSRSALFDLSSG